jgi:two-component system, cell cycle response regulator
MRVLIADDHPDSAESFAILLRAWGLEPIIVHDGLAALAFLRESTAPTLALLDWIMPGLDGLGVCREIRRETHRPYVYVILVTGRSGKAQMLDGLLAGADDYLVKPVDPNELHARLATARRILDLQDQLLATQRLLREQATRDSLTSLWNRAMILDTLQRELTRSQREHQPLAVIMADIDHFKQINDDHGHFMGDQVLRQTAQRLQGVLRPYDTVGRYGGEEFLIVLSGCDTSAALTLAERLRHCLDSEPITEGDRAFHVTLSLGVCAWDGHMTAQALLQTADGALYEAKRAGRNCVRSSDAPLAVPAH